MPRRYGGLETDIATYAKIWIEMARGDMSAGWCMCLMANHALQVGSWFPREAQDEIFGDGSFRAPAVTFPLTGRARRVAAGWELHGTVGYCSGAPYCTTTSARRSPRTARRSSSSPRAARSRCSTTGATSSA